MMTKFLILFSTLAFLASQFNVQAVAVSPAAAPVDCLTLVFNMMDCVSFLTEGGGESKPGKVCCGEFRMVVAADAECLCDAISIAHSLGFNVNMTRANALPSDCGVSNFSISHCFAVPSPAAPPPVQAPAPAPSLAKRPDEAAAPAPKKNSSTIITGNTFSVISLIIFSMATVIY